MDADIHDKQSVDAEAEIITIPMELRVWQVMAVYWTLAHFLEKQITRKVAEATFQALQSCIARCIRMLKQVCTMIEEKLEC